MCTYMHTQQKPITEKWAGACITTMCVCVCVWVRVHGYTYIYIYINKVVLTCNGIMISM